MEKLELKALGKINLGLDVLGRRENGYHDVRMVMQTLFLYDNVTIIRTQEPGIVLETNLDFLPIDKENIAWKAANMLIEEFQIQDGVKIILDKRIPVAAGMAGGSTDCAAALVGMNQLFDLKLSQQTLMDYGVTLGADVPYCILRGTALSEGIGEVLTSLPPVPQCHVLIAKPPIHVSTKFVYENLKLNELETHPDIDGMVEAIKENNLSNIASRLGNVLETVTIPEYPEIAILKQLMLEAGAMNSLMSGSGPTVFGLFEREEDAQKAYELCKAQNPSNVVYLTNFFNKNKS